MREANRLLDILVIAVCAVLAEAATFADIAPYGRCKHPWLKRFLALPNGIRSHDPFRRVLMLVDPDRFEHCFLENVDLDGIYLKFARSMVTGRA